MGLSSEKKVQIFDEIWEDFEEYIIYIPWQPLKNGKIYYEQVGAGLNYIYLLQIDNQMDTLSRFR
jgi:hypothetical protein